jgi:hypothetical protein
VADFKYPGWQYIDGFCQSQRVFSKNYKPILSYIAMALSGPYLGSEKKDLARNRLDKSKEKMLIPAANESTLPLS